MQCNAKGIALCKKWEALRLKAYNDGRGTWTIGYGHTLNVTQGMTCVPAQADAWFFEDMNHVYNILSALVHAQVNSNQFSALCVLAFNVGTEAFALSSLLKDVNASQWAAAADEFLRWDKEHINGVMVQSPGLLNRRREERELFLDVV